MKERASISNVLEIQRGISTMWYNIQTTLKKPRYFGKNLIIAVKTANYYDKRLT